MRGLIFLLVFCLGSVAYGQCPGGVCRPAAERVKQTASVLVSPAKQVVAGAKQRIERRPLLRRIFRRSR